jgi:hypothetical protein
VRRHTGPTIDDIVPLCIEIGDLHLKAAHAGLNDTERCYIRNRIKNCSPPPAARQTVAPLRTPTSHADEDPVIEEAIP